MNLIAILSALGLEQWRAFRWRASVERLFVQYVRAVERRLNGGTAQQGTIAAVIALAPPVLLAAVVFFALTALHPLLGLAWNIAVLYFLMGFRRFSHAFTDVRDALAAGNLGAARRAIAAWRGGEASELTATDIAKLAIERGLIDSYRQVFATLFWFTVLPGPAGAVLYRAATLLAAQWQDPVGGAATRRRSPRRERSSAGRRGRFSSCSTGSRCVSPRCRLRSSAISRTPPSAGGRKRKSGRRRTAASTAASCSRAARARWA